MVRRAERDVESCRSGDRDWEPHRLIVVRDTLLWHACASSACCLSTASSRVVPTLFQLN
jgi:hypothetical protein